MSEVSTQKGKQVFVVTLEKTKKSISIFKISDTPAGKELKKVHKIDIMKTKLEFTPVNIRLLSNGVALILGYQFDAKDKIYSYAGIAAIFDQIELSDDTPVLREIKDIVNLDTTEYQKMQDDLEFKLVEHKAL